MTPRLIVSDLDGTLLGSDHRLHDSTIEVLQELVRQGHHLALASGRHYHDMRVFRDELGVPAHLISTNGAYTHDPDGGLVSASHLNPDHAHALIHLPRPPQVRLNLYREAAGMWTPKRHTCFHCTPRRAFAMRSCHRSRWTPTA
ncbi:hypothetical protein HAALTHF_47860n [Vreelandella aquamarina]|nr:hypothetical protein HAALTHF_47860n [Halomonas axialensis]